MPLSFKRTSGFTLVELAIVLLIVAILSAGAIAALRVQNERSRLLETKGQLEDAREALLNFAAVTGALPCPDTNGDGDAESSCTAGLAIGTLPWRTLALPGTDPWGQALRYAVGAATSGPGQGSFTNATNLKLTTEGGLAIKNSGGDKLASLSAVAFALWSTGADASDNTWNGSEVIAESPTSDDMVVWVSRFILLGRMLEAGRDIPQ